VGDGGNSIKIADGIPGQKRQTGLKDVLRLVLRCGLSLMVMSCLKGLTSARKGIALVVDQTLYFQSRLYVATAIKPLSCAAFAGLELGKLRLPKSQDVGFYLAQVGHISNLEIETVRDRG
jgi:hypothetical protein